MENTASKAEFLKPVIIKAGVGVPLAVSVAAFICGWIMAKKSLSKAFLTNPEVQSHETNNTQQGIKREESSHGENEESTSVSRGNLALEQEISELRSRIDGLQMRELALRLQFDRYCDMKEQESLLVEIRNLLSLETVRAEFLEREVSSMEAEYRRLESFLVQYLRNIGQLEERRSENRLLRRKLKKLRRKSKAQSRQRKEQALKIRAQEAEILENRGASQTRIDVISKLEDEIRELRSVLENLQNEKNELLKKLDEAEKSYASKLSKVYIKNKDEIGELHRVLEQLQIEKKRLLKKLDEAEKSHASKIEAEYVSKEEYKRLLNEIEQLKKERGDEARELIHLRWINACLRRRLKKERGDEARELIHLRWINACLRGQQEQQKNEERGQTEEEVEGSSTIPDDSEPDLGHTPPRLGAAPSDGARPKRKRLLKTLKRWVEGSEKARVKPEETEEHETKGLDEHGASYGEDKTQVSA